MTNNLVIWDWNGTLLDDTALCVRATNVVLRKFGKPEISVAQFQEHYAIPMIATYEALGFTSAEIMASRLEIWEQWRSVYESSSAQLPLRTGVHEALNLLRDYGAQNIVLSNHLREDITAHATRLKVGDHFTAILANSLEEATTMQRRAKIDRLREHIGQGTPSRAVVIGDTVEEIEIGKELRMTTIAVTGGTCSQSRLEAAGPDHLIHDFREMPAIMTSLFPKQSAYGARPAP